MIALTLRIGELFRAILILTAIATSALAAHAPAYTRFLVPFYGIVSVTNNDTQQVTIITPKQY